MNVEWLMDYIVLIDSGSLSKAAEKRAITHTAFGRRIKLLEEWAGVDLIERTQPIKPTQAGQLFLEAAYEVTATLSTVRAQLQGTINTSQQSIQIATGRTLGSNFFPQWYRQVTQDTGFTQMSVLTSGTEFAILRFIAKESDLLIAYQTPMTDLLLNKKQYEYKVLGQEIIVPVTAAANTDAILQQLSKKANIHKTNWLTYDKSLSLKGLVSNFLNKKDILGNLNSVFESDNYETLKAMVVADVGIAWLPFSIVKNELISKQLYKIGGQQLQLTVDIVLYKRVVETNPSVQQVWDAVQPSSINLK